MSARLPPGLGRARSEGRLNISGAWGHIQRHLARQRAESTDPPSAPDDQLWRAVARLAPRARTAVALRYVADLPEAEIAEIMGVARGTVAATLSSARKQLALQLAPVPERTDR